LRTIAQSQIAALGERYPLLGPVPDDDVIVKAEVEEPGAVRELPGEAKILAGRSGVARGVVVDEDHSGGPFPECWTEYLTRVDQGGRERPGRHEGMHQIAILSVQQDDPEMLAVIVDRIDEIAGEEDDGLG
jgi:hypothetical protein